MDFVGKFRIIYLYQIIIEVHNMITIFEMGYQVYYNYVKNLILTKAIPLLFYEFSENAGQIVSESSPLPGVHYPGYVGTSQYDLNYDSIWSAVSSQKYKNYIFIG